MSVIVKYEIENWAIEQQQVIERDDNLYPYADRTVSDADTYFADDVGQGNEFAAFHVYLLIWP